MPSPWKTGRSGAPAAAPPHTPAAGSESAPPRVDPAELRKACGGFATGVTVITSVGRRNELIGMTANSFSAVSLEPPLVLFSLMRHSYSWRAFLSARHFAVNVLSTAQAGLSDRFARPLQDKWDGVGYQTWDSGCPILDDCLANLECEYEYTHDGGDHVIFVGRVLRMAINPELEPLVFFRGRYTRLQTPPATHQP